ncbi:MAG: hypothetical protein A2V90_01195 [Gammaproteobacteria bacterium RBG_16_57_12]|nr:MAG: hypothetical protein A2V90_01195 [Gammaproteobacteria bacterium RBG_16_57_12]
MLKIIYSTYLGAERHQLSAIKIDRDSPVGAQRNKIEPRLVIGTPRHYSIAIFDSLFDLLPDVIAHLC